MMTYILCRECDEDFPVKPAELIPCVGDDDMWQAKCPHCGATVTVDIEDYVIPVDSKVLWNGREAYIVRKNLIGCWDLSQVRYVIRFPDNNEFVTVPAGELTLAEDNRHLRKEGDLLQRVCHYPRNQARSNVPCYNCVDRTKCNADIFNTLWLYESSGLSPTDVTQVSRVLKRYGLTVKDMAVILSNYKFGKQNAEKKEGGQT